MKNVSVPPGGENTELYNFGHFTIECFKKYNKPNKNLYFYATF